MVFKTYDFLADDVKTIRKKVFMEEQGFENEFDDIDNFAIHIVLYDKETPVATCRVFKSEDEDSYILGRLAIMKEYRGRSIGTDMMKEAENLVIRNNGSSLKLHAQCRVKNFYAQLGYTKYGKVEDDEGCPHIWMKKKL